METNNKVVEVINVLCDKLGVAIDWTSANILPYVQDLMGRFIKMEIAKSVFWVCFAVVGLTFLGCLLIVFSTKAKDNWDDCWNFYNYATLVTGVLLGTSVLVVFICISDQIIHIIECSIMPEKVFLDYILNYTK